MIDSIAPDSIIEDNLVDIDNLAGFGYIDSSYFDYN